MATFVSLICPVSLKKIPDMKKIILDMKKLIWLNFLFVAFIIGACGSDDEGTGSQDLQLSIAGLTDLGNDFAYEGWLILDSGPVTTGVFSVDANGSLSQTSFTVDPANVTNASAFVLTIEPVPDSDPTPSAVHILAGDVSNGQASLSVGHAAALGDDYSSSSGTYILATPTNDEDNDENSGVWFLDPTQGPGAGLNLAVLPAGWKYEGWAVIDGQPVSTGTFTLLDQADDSDVFSGDIAGPPFPGEDFLMNAPGGLTFPTDLAGATIVISIEPEPDNSEAPFLLKPLVSEVAADAIDHTPYSMDLNLASFPSGTVSTN